jgi:hypothetical protein
MDGATKVAVAAGAARATRMRRPASSISISERPV